MTFRIKGRTQFHNFREQGAEEETRTQGAKVTGSWRRLRNVGLLHFYFSTNIVSVIKLRMLEWVGCVERMGKQGNPWNVMLVIPERTRPLRIHRWEENMKMDLKKHNGTV